MLGLGNTLSGGITTPAFTPLGTGSNLALWLKYNENITTDWSDASGNNNHAVGTDDFEPSADDGGWLFNPGTEDPDVASLTSAITASSQEGFMAFFVLDHDANDTRTLLGVNSDAEFLEIMNSKKIRIKIDGTATVTTFSANQFVNDTKYILGVKREAGATGNIYIYKDGTLVTPTSQQANPGAIDFNTIGARGSTDTAAEMDRMFDGHIYELLVYEGATELTAGEITKIHDYLKSVHGI